MAAKDNLQMQLFQPVETPKAETKVTPKGAPAASEVVHGSMLPRREFMKAPILHVGERSAAEFLLKEQLYGTQRPLKGNVTESQLRSDLERRTHPLDFSEHAQFHDVELSDTEANRAHKQFMQSKNLPVSQLVSMSTYHEYGDPRTTGSDARVRGAVEALKQNKILRYRNTRDMTEDEKFNFDYPEDAGDDYEPHTKGYVVPSPWLNMRMTRRKDPMEQPVLPMDYSDTMESETTKRARNR